MGLNKQKKKDEWCPDQSDVPSNTRGLVRCPTCNKRLAPRAIRNPPTSDGILGSIKGLRLPPHKAK